MNPMHECRGLCLASTATQKGDLSALASMTDTSESCNSGHHDTVPVLAHRSRTTCKQEAFSLSVRCFTLAVRYVPTVFSGTHLAAWAGHPRAVSPCELAPVRRRWSARQQGALAHAQ